MYFLLLWWFKKEKNTGRLDMDGTANTGAVNPVQIQLESLRI